ncbi:hypothetical protein J5N97_029555 [Dioscorea zingiberensis]|uniref:Protein kinase domain-containing protein n=1 Tax=Dioscorea zingiberensis TaxID=325984 RepID=A0A9D5C1E6_9LILI|nr:hypothetical protein J5N97_029555 [Dioscorea zingiberensis]
MAMLGNGEFKNFHRFGVLNGDHVLTCYKVIKEVGDGTFGTVWRAINKQNSEVVAIKKMKKNYYSWEECMNLREVKSLRRMNHPNIVKLKEVIREHNILYFIFEYMDCNLYQLMKDRGKPFSEVEVRNWLWQSSAENLLVTKDIIKIADFGLAREVSSKPPYTEYVSTRWYRAPEVLLQSSIYDSAVDMWAMGAIIAELLTLRPLFPGASEADEIYKICSIIGSPSYTTWAEGLQLADVINYQFPQFACVHLSALIPSASEDAINLISSLCSWNPRKRPTAAEALQHSFFQPCFYIPPSLRPKATGIPKTPPSVGPKGALEPKGSRRFSTGTLSNTNPTSNFASAKNSNTSMRTGVQRKLEVDYQEPQTNDRSMKISPKEPRYRPLARNNPVPGYHSGRNLRRVASDASEKVNSRNTNCNGVGTGATEKNGILETSKKLAHLSINSGPQAVKQAPVLKAGGWQGQSDTQGRSNGIPSYRTYSRKVVG